MRQAGKLAGMQADRCVSRQARKAIMQIVQVGRQLGQGRAGSQIGGQAGILTDRQKRQTDIHHNIHTYMQEGRKADRHRCRQRCWQLGMYAVLAVTAYRGGKQGQQAGKAEQASRQAGEVRQVSRQVQVDRQAGRQADMQIHSQVGRQAGWQVGRGDRQGQQAGKLAWQIRHVDRQVRQACRQICRQVDRQADWQTCRQVSRQGQQLCRKGRQAGLTSWHDRADRQAGRSGKQAGRADRQAGRPVSSKRNISPFTLYLNIHIHRKHVSFKFFHLHLFTISISRNLY